MFLEKGIVNKYKFSENFKSPDIVIFPFTFIFDVVKLVTLNVVVLKFKQDTLFVNKFTLSTSIDAIYGLSIFFKIFKFSKYLLLILII